MANLLKTGSDWLEGQRDLHLTEDVTYARGAVVLAAKATIGKSNFEIMDSSGFNVQNSTIDFLILESYLTSLLPPEIGDIITAAGKTYEVLSIPGLGHYRYSDSFNKTLRIYTKLVA